MINQCAPVMTRTERNRLAFLTSTQVVDGLPAIACALTFLLRDPRVAGHTVGTDETPSPGPSTR